MSDKVAQISKHSFRDVQENSIDFNSNFLGM